MPRDGEFWLRVGFGIIGLLAAGWMLVTTPRGSYLELPSVLVGIASALVLASAFVPAIRGPRR